jgi:hypothetical protein
MLSFYWGIITNTLGVLVTISCWIDPFPLRQYPDGSVGIFWLDQAWAGALGLTLLSIVLASFGRGWPRVMLIVSCTLSLLLLYGSLLQNGV